MLERIVLALLEDDMQRELFPALRRGLKEKSDLRGVSGATGSTSCSESSASASSSSSSSSSSGSSRCLLGMEQVELVEMVARETLGAVLHRLVSVSLCGVGERFQELERHLLGGREEEGREDYIPTTTTE